MRSLFTLLCFSFSLNASAAEMLTLEECLAIAIRNSSPVLKAQSNDDAAASEVLRGYFQFVPDVQVAATFGYEKGNKFFYQGNPGVANTENYGLGYQVSSSLNLFNGLADFSGLKVALYRRGYSSLTLRRARQLIGLDVAQSYLQVMLDRRLVEIARQAFEASSSQERVTAKQVELGAKNPSDLATQQAQTSTSESLLISAQNQARISLLRLVQKLRLDASGDYDVAQIDLISMSRSDNSIAAEDALVDEALRNRADLAAARDNALAASWEVTAAHAGYWPTLSARFDLYSNSRTLTTQSLNGSNQVPAHQDPLFTQLGNHNYFDVTVNLSWSLFDRWTTPRNVSRARAAARNLMIDAQDQERQVMVEVKQGMLDYNTAQALLASSAKASAAAQKAYDLVQGRYAAGIANATDLQVALSTNVSAQFSHAQALVNLDLKRRALDLAIGR